MNEERVEIQVTEGEYGIELDFVIVDITNADVSLEVAGTVSMKIAIPGETAVAVGTGSVEIGAGDNGEDVARVAIGSDDVANLAAGRYMAQVTILHAAQKLIPEWFWLVVEEAI